MPQPPTVAVLGCGPGGMFFLHAIEYQRRQLQEKGDKAGLAALPIATCFERASAPGGVWRAHRKFETSGEQAEAKKTSIVSTSDETDETNMYEALWTNGPKENIEFFDYTYVDHFGSDRQLPVYMPRQLLLEYMTARVTRNCPTIFDDFVKFDTTVTNVKYNDATAKFEVTTKDNLTNDVVTGEYDKCIWAAGENGKPFMPQNLVSMLREGGFKGNIVHSSDSSDLKANVEGKRILMIGGSYSAEDLALMAIKLGAEKIYISYRRAEPVVEWTSHWPQNKVELIPQQVPVVVKDEGNCIQFAKVTLDAKSGNYEASEEVETEIENIDTIIFCTGYSCHDSMLDESLRSGFEAAGIHSIPSDWKMKDNPLNPVMGDIIPAGAASSTVDYTFVYDKMYRDVLISNPSMMYLWSESDDPLLYIDVSAWKFLAYITGKTELPPPEEMLRRNQEQKLRELSMPYYRYYADYNYRAAMDVIDDDHEVWKHDEEFWDDVTREGVLVTAREMRDGHYPVDLGCYEDFALTETGEKMVEMSKLSSDHRKLPGAQDENEYEWRTFRDYSDEDAQKFASIFTGTKAIPLKKRWMDINEADDEV